MKIKVKKILKVILTAALIIGCFFFAKSKLENYTGQRDYEEAVLIATGGQPLTIQVQSSKADPPSSQPDTEVDEITSPEPEIEADPYVETLKSIDLKALQEVNPEVIGWVLIPDTEISYPLMHHENNEYYLDHTWKTTGNFMGSIFIDSQNEADFSDFNTILYGHSMNNGAMFGMLDNYSDPEFLQAHPSIYIMIESGIYKYDIFAVHRAGMKTIAFGMKMNTEKKRQEFIDFALDYSEYDTGIVPTTDSKMLTLATCSYSRHKVRLVVQATIDEGASYIFPAE